MVALTQLALRAVRAALEVGAEVREVLVYLLLELPIEEVVEVAVVEQVAFKLAQQVVLA